MNFVRFPKFPVPKLKDLDIPALLVGFGVEWYYGPEAEEFAECTGDLPRLNYKESTLEDLTDRMLLAKMKYDKIFQESLRELGPYDHNSPEEVLKKMRQAEKIANEKIAAEQKAQKSSK